MYVLICVGRPTGLQHHICTYLLSDIRSVCGVSCMSYESCMSYDGIIVQYIRLCVRRSFTCDCVL